MNPKPEPVWDLSIRVFHWCLPLLVAGAWASEEFGSMRAHAWCGYALLVLVAWRILWGFVGSTHARFASFLRSPLAAWRHLRGDVRQTEGHNPAGAWSVMAMLVLLLVQPLTGMFNENDIGFSGPLAHLYGGRYTSDAGEWHEWNFNLLMLLVALHVVIVWRYQRRGQDLLRLMISGGVARAAVRTRPWWLAVILLAICAGALWFGLSRVPQPEVFL